MNQNNARWLWNDSCYRMFGATSEQEISQVTALGGAALANDVPTVCYGQKDHLQKVAAFLRQWADNLDGGINKTEC